MGTTLGGVTAVKNFTFVVCPDDALKKSATFHEDLEYIIPKDLQATGQSTLIVKNVTDYNHMIIFEDCEYCKEFVLYRIMMADGITEYTGSNYFLDTDGNLVIDTLVPFTTVRVFIEAKIDTVASPECGAVGDKIQIPLYLEVCGAESVIIEDPTIWNMTFWYSDMADLKISNITSEYKISTPSKCNMSYYELRADPLKTLEASGRQLWD